MDTEYTYGDYLMMLPSWLEILYTDQNTEHRCRVKQESKRRSPNPRCYRMKLEFFWPYSKTSRACGESEHSPPSSSQGNSPPQAGLSVTNGASSSKVRLPKLRHPTFDGKFKE